MLVALIIVSVRIARNIIARVHGLRTDALDLGKAQAPPTIAHSLSVLDDKGEAHEMPLAPLAVP